MLLSPSLSSWSIWITAILILLGASLVVSLLLLRYARRVGLAAMGELEALGRVNTCLANSEDMGQGLVRALDAVLKCTHTAAGRIWLVDARASKLRFRLHRGLFPESFEEPSELSFGSEPAGRAAESGRSVLSDCTNELPGLRALGFLSFASVPLHARNRVVGVLDLAARHTGELDASKLGLLEQLGGVLGLAIDNDALSSRIEAQVDEEQRLWQAGLEIASAENYGALMRSLVGRARELAGAEAAAVCVWDEKRQSWAVRAVGGVADVFDMNAKREAPPTAGGIVGCPVVKSAYCRGHVDAPLSRDGRPLGCLCLVQGEMQAASEDAKDFLQKVAGQAAIAVDRVQAAEEAGQRAATLERERLAREMHDTLAQVLGFVNVKTMAAHEHLAQNRLDQARVELQQLNGLAQELYADTRELILGLRTEPTPERTLLPALADYIERFSQFSDVAVNFQADGLEGERFPPSVEVQLIRVVQEGLSNVRKHAGARNARVLFEKAGEWATLAIEDDGRGFDPANVSRGWWPRFGLQSMRERVEAIGGTFSIDSAPGRGTTIAVQVPLVYRSRADDPRSSLERRVRND